MSLKLLQVCAHTYVRLNISAHTYAILWNEYQVSAQRMQCHEINRT